MFRIGIDRVGVKQKSVGLMPDQVIWPADVCPLDGARGVFRRTTLVCPRCGRVLGGF